MNDIFQRHGILCGSRKCPRHHQAMEIATDFNAADCVASTLQWWCEICRGYWSELYFERQAEALDKSMLGIESNFELECPDCGSKDVRRQCHFQCCDNFICGACNLVFAVDHEVLEASSCSVEELRHLQIEKLDRSESEDDIRQIVHLVIIETEDCDSEFCSLHPQCPVTLIERTNIIDERLRFAWGCIDCPPDQQTQQFVFQFMKPIFTFFQSLHSPYQCRICHHGMFSGGIDCLRCDSCGTLMKLTMIKNGSVHFEPPCSSGVAE